MNTQNAIVLGGLLHDIGKFMQRAQLPLSEQSKKMTEIICPVYKGRYSRRHVLWTNDFFKGNKEYFPVDVSEPATENSLDNITNFASYHHRPGTPLQMIIQEADYLSSGERLEKDIEDEVSGKETYKKVRLHSVFEEVDLGNNPSKEHEYRYELSPLVPNKTIFPKFRKELSPSEGELLGDKYKGLWDEFLKNFKKFPKNNFNTFLNALISLLERYTWCIPSSAVNLPDISLFDHLKTTAAIAACLYEYHFQTKTINEDSIKERTIKKFLLIGGDLSGIQKYIFNLSHSNTKGTSKRLRARSFYLQVLTQATIHYILHQIRLPLICNVIDTGGRFVLLAPNTEDTKASLTKIYREISDWYRKMFAGELVLNVNWDLELTGKDFKAKEFSAVMDTLNEYIEREKYQKLSKVLLNENEWEENKFIIEEMYKYEKGNCDSCEKQPAIESGDEEGKFCKQCSEQKKLGAQLTEAEVLAYSLKKPFANNKSVSFFDDKYFLSFPKKSKVNPKDYYLIREFYHPDEKILNFGIEYLANYIPVFGTEETDKLCSPCDEKNQCKLDKTKSKHKTFRCIATKAVELNKQGNKVGSPMLGILKADVDRLGLIFGIGLAEKVSISRYITLSRMLNLFFSGYVENVMHNKQYKNIYTVYSGGDDLFLISDWETMIGFAAQFYKDFRNFTCQNKDITLSAGILMIKPTFPIRRAADMTEELLKKSKNKGRDKLTMFYTTVEWKNLRELLDFGKLLDEEFKRENSKIRSSFLHRLLKYHNMYLDAQKGKVENLRFHSLMAYDVKRNIEDTKKINGEEKILNEETLKELLKLYNIPPEHMLMKNLKIPLFWALYKNRGHK